MAENEYLDSRKARRWSAVAEAVRNRLPIGELGVLILDRFRKTLRNISKDMPLAECLAAVDSQAELERAFDGVNGARDVKDLLLQAVIERLPVGQLDRPACKGGLNIAEVCDV